MSRLTVGSRVRVKPAPPMADVETQYYLQEFDGLIGTLVEITHSGSGIYAFHVEFSKKARHGIFYESELELVTD